MRVAVWVDPRCDEIIAHLPGVIGAVHDTAQQGARRAEAILRSRRHEGHSRITVTRGTVDSFVNLNDERGDHAAGVIEYGRSGGKHGPTLGVGALAGAF